MGLIFLIADLQPASATLVPRAVQRIHEVAARHTKNLARDLRVAFGRILVEQPTSTSQHVVYCKPGRPVLGGTTGNGTSGTSSISPSSTSRAGSTSTKTSSSAASTGTGGSSTPSSPWKLTETHAGNDFFNGWDFHLGDDPTHGIVQYVSQDVGRSSGILEVNNNGNAVMRVETTPNVANTRQSIRITTLTSFNGGLVVMSAVHMPTGCGTWPAFWTNGPDWPAGGEIDIVEAVNDYTNNQMTIHTNPGCTLPTADKSSLRISGSVIGGTDCAAITTGNQGCGIRASSSNSFGAGFNKNGGGTYAMQWDSSGISVYFFPKGSEPSDLTSNVPLPETWGLPIARWPADQCNPYQFFNNHHAIFDTTLCGDWAAGVWSSAGIPGQEQSCAERTGFSTCEAFLRLQQSSKFSPEMFHYTPSAYLPSPHSYSPAPLSNPRDRYLTALAEAKAAEADFLAAEAAQREEEDLRRRLEEIQYRKHKQQLRSRYDRIPYGHLDSYPSYDRLASLRQQVEAEERLRLVALREAQASREIEAARQEAHRRRQQEQRKQARLVALLNQSVKAACQQCSCSNQDDKAQLSCCISQKSRHQTNPALHPTLRALLTPEARAPEPVCFCQSPNSRLSAHISPQKLHVDEDNFVEALLKQVSAFQPEVEKPSAPALSQPAPHKPIAHQSELNFGVEDFLDSLFKSFGVEEQPAPHKERPEAQLIKQIADILLPPFSPPSQPTPSASSSKAAQPTQEPAKAAPTAPAPVAEPKKADPTALAAESKKASTSPAASLKQQLEARFNNEYHSEVRDTIQAIFASLQDAENLVSASTSSPKASASGKGKAKVEPSTSTANTGATDSTANPTSKDVVNSLNEVRSIEAAFLALEADFTFPATLDFIAAHLIPGSPASSDSESSSAATHLAYTSRNHPVRFYEQALSALLTQLDSVDSFGNDELRASRKEVVSRVEKALEELEKEVEGRYRTRLSKEAKAAAPSEPQPITDPEIPAIDPTDSTAVPEIVVTSTFAPTESLDTQLAATTTSEEAPVSAQGSEAAATSTESTAMAEPTVTTDIPTISDEPNLSSSSATNKGYEIEAEDIDTPVAISSPAEPESFLLTAAQSEPAPKRPTNKDSDDVASDWSEVEA
ncbi:hypothetical protein H0H87_010181 [Tephrocybe sp. NHM501043]|nr:hypothetical protein H0H87_010181 [Tephrocybe sp. NHM501043]